jgi:ABC-type molybdate transport system substrate-binding protein
VVILCDPAAVAALEAKGLVMPPRWVLEQTRDRLALVTRADSPATVKNLEELARPQAGTIGLADPTQSASGAAARDLLAARGLASPLAGRQREFKDLAALEAAIGAGEVTLGFVRETRLAKDADKNKKFKILLTLDPLAGKQPPYLALVANGRSARPGAAHQLWGYLEPWARNPGFFLVPKPGSGNVIALPAERE